MTHQPAPHPPVSRRADDAVPGILLAGGESRRFGAPKALARVGGRTIAGRVRDVLRAVTPDVRAIANRPELMVELGVQHRPDAVPGIGALGGILTALRWAVEDGRRGALVAACDLPFLSPGLFRALLASAEATGADAVLPESAGPHGFEPLCAWYGARCLPAVEEMAAAGERRAHRLAERVRAVRLPLEEVARHGDPSILFFNVNTVDDHREAERIDAAAPPDRTLPPVVSIVGRKNSGKTTLTVAVAAELKRRGRRIATIKHGHHAFETDEPGKDSWRHFHEGGAEAVVMAGAGKIALVMRTDGEPDPVAIVRDFYAGRGYDLVLVEGYKHGPFPRVEIFRRAVHGEPLHDLADPAAPLVAVVTDDATLVAACPVIRLDPRDPAGAHVSRLTDLLEAFAGERTDG
jgi:molybdopterin-guanine dinucleotide biosynthesis protein MobB